MGRPCEVRVKRNQGLSEPPAGCWLSVNGHSRGVRCLCDRRIGYWGSSRRGAVGESE